MNKHDRIFSGIVYPLILLCGLKQACGKTNEYIVIRLSWCYLDFHPLACCPFIDKLMKSFCNIAMRTKDNRPLASLFM